ncbi:hypothetical protein PFISCL1PPCAC_22138 [Pristionchus fissidentatus]|uniref:Uncharacterized protein n=1 Tax=Pristionchus fissidentatus TaxID=1538716 RepID=A0AAV5WF00_9BILA|nr:hypothetical protein PFISCL1PPCAC_22138 [Pristionchus fissidentatus]
MDTVPMHSWCTSVNRLVRSILECPRRPEPLSSLPLAPWSRPVAPYPLPIPTRCMRCPTMSHFPDW